MTTEIATIPVENLLLDDQNPRLASSVLAAPSQEELIRILWTQMAVDEIADSIAANGYHAHEPILVIPAEGRGGRTGLYTVIEGNRRLAAVLLLRNADLRQRIKATDIPRIGAKQRALLDQLPAVIYQTRQSLWAYLGFRHVNGTRPWDAFSKARYVARVHEDFHVPLREIAERIGDRHSTVQRLYRGFAVLRQAEQATGFDRNDLARNRFYFSHLYTAVDQPEFQRFLGLSGERLESRRPVATKKLPELAELMTWLYGKRSGNLEPVIRSQNPDLNMLRNIVGNRAALSLLRSGRSLDAAYDASLGDRRRFRDALALAKEELQKAKATVITGYDGELDLADTISDIVLLASSIQEEMQRRADHKVRKAI